MPRRRSPTRFRELIEAATRAFIDAGGVRRTQMSDVARSLGAAKGTLYLYVESKEALFQLALRYADREIPAEPSEGLPVPAPAPGGTAALIRARLTEEGGFPRLAAALSDPADPADPIAVRAECEAVISEIFDTMARNRTAIRLVNASARDVPSLAAIWYEAARGPLHERLTTWVRARVAAGAFPPIPDAATAARMVIESCTWFAVHRHWDPRPYDPDAGDGGVRAAVIGGMARSLCGD